MIRFYTFIVLAPMVLTACTENNVPIKDQGNMIAKTQSTGKAGHRDSRGELLSSDGPVLTLPPPIVSIFERVIAEAETQIIQDTTDLKAIPWLILKVPSGTYYMWAPGTTIEMKGKGMLLRHDKFEKLVALERVLRISSGQADSKDITDLYDDLTKN